MCVGYFDELSARVLLDRLPIPAIAVGDDGIVAFANPACQTMLGHLKISLVGPTIDRILGNSPNDRGRSRE